MTASSYGSTSGQGKTFSRARSIFGQGKTLFAPAPNAAVHREHTGVAHLLQIVSRQRRAKPAATVKHQKRILIGHATLNIALDDSFSQVDRPGQMIGRVFAFFAHVDQHKLLLAVQLRLDLIDRNFVNPFLGILDNLQKTSGVLMSHGSSIQYHSKVRLYNETPSLLF